MLYFSARGSCAIALELQYIYIVINPHPWLFTLDLGNNQDTYPNTYSAIVDLRTYATFNDIQYSLLLYYCDRGQVLL